jgi:hypothetical protein
VFARFTSGLSRPAEEDNPSPNRMQGNEHLFGYAAAVVIALGGVLDLMVTTGKGAPAHPSTWTAYIGILLAIALVVSIQFRHRMISPFVAIFGAFFVTLAKGPDSLETPHIVVLMVSVAFAVIVSLRQRRDQKALTPTLTSAERRAAADARRRRRKGEPDLPAPVKRPSPNRRYTPPKNAAKPPKSPRR